jgi:Gram-negative bacterial TonB protein C-terminal
MRKFPYAVFTLIMMGASLGLGRCEDLAGRVKKAVAKSTLDQPGTRPFHLKADLAPSLQRDSASGRTGTVEIWWKSPTEWRRKVNCPIFHQIEVVNGGHVWQKNDGDYFPEWLQETSVELIDPLPKLQYALDQIDRADIKHLMGSTYIEWMIPSSDGKVHSWIGATVALTDSTGLLFYDGAFGWGGLFHDYKNFHGRMVARKVSVGTPEVTAIATVLEPLKETSGMFDTQASGGDAQLLQTVAMNEMDARKHLLPAAPFTWPAAQDGPLEGVATADILIDRAGKVREVVSVVSTNSDLNDAMQQQLEAMRFKPFVQDGVPVQVLTRITMPFKTIRDGK